ncbi:hypothetical protein QQX98_005164 [Neonectria punicea]|uniref:Agouti domain-containing protein n=1 Tax=Neonectria punicea TaxID=979145 RepID=A0ABR1H616_9HYPO
MPCSKIRWLFIFFTTTLAAPTPVAPHEPNPGPFAALLNDMAKDPHGALHLGPDGVLRSLAANGTVIDQRAHPETAPPLRRSPADMDPEEVLGACSPPLACHNSTTCGDGCGSCTYLGFFPYGLCLAG